MDFKIKNHAQLLTVLNGVDNLKHLVLNAFRQAQCEINYKKELFKQPVFYLASPV